MLPKLPVPLGHGEPSGGFLSSTDPAYNTSLHYLPRPFDGRNWSDRANWSAREFKDRERAIYPTVPIGPAYLLLNTTFHDLRAVQSLRWNVTQDWIREKNNQWTSITSTQSGSVTNFDSDPSQIPGIGLSIDASLCYGAAFWTENMFIEANRTHSNTEPVILQDGLQQLGVSTTMPSYEERSILELSEHEVARQLELEKEIISMDENHFWSDSLMPDDSQGAVNHRSMTLAQYQSLLSMMETVKSGSAPGVNSTRYLFPSRAVVTSRRLSVSEERATLFQQALRNTNSPAKALQALFHTVMADGFYKHLSYYNVPSEYSASYSVPALQPARKIGLAIVLTALALHVILVSFITLYLSGILSPNMPPFYASINNVWQTHAQLMNSEIESILRAVPRERRRRGEEEKKKKKKKKKNSSSSSLFVLSPGVEDEDGAVRLKKRIIPVEGTKK